MWKAYPGDDAARRHLAFCRRVMTLVEYMFEQSTSSPEVIARFDELFERHYPYFAQHETRGDVHRSLR
jgi:hypothetical protein